MNKSELITAMHEKLPLLKKEVKSCVDSIFNLLCDALCEGDDIEIRGFGHFTRRLHKEHQARNPMTGEKVTASAKYVIHFKTGKEMRERVSEAAGKPLKTHKEQQHAW